VTFVAFYAATISARPIQFTIDNCRRTSNTRIYKNRAGSTIPGTGAALHAGIPIDNHHLFTIHFKDMMWANNGTHSAASTFFLIEF
jgi:hypothetical protein